MKHLYFLIIFGISVIPGMGQNFPNDGTLGGWATASAHDKFSKDAITTSFKDADTTQPLPIYFGDTLKPIPIAYMPKGDSIGSYVLPPGLYEMTVQSYCIKAGTYGPSQGDGYCYAALNGPQKNLMISALTNAKKHPRLLQQDVQVLLWAIIARARFNDMNERLKVITLTLLNAKEILQMNKTGLGLIPKPFLAKMATQLPPLVYEIVRAENQMRQLFYNANTVYSEYERWALRSGMAPVDRPDIRRGRWCKHPCGYYIRFYPQSYNKTKVQVYVPEDFSSRANPPCSVRTKYEGAELHGVLFNLLGGVAVPANTQSQRLLLSNTEAL
ncbi:MAG TPA: hypothetical protein PK798_10175 [Flavobacteriales bacterium]|nr:hypothetical protein [Flavobacteriales bacterium]HRJ35114.1 hypothetical protein [Flavobacteriales bacterium]HRJ39146.1 hypothetical protein [Flavobacteriales bacterium]